MKKIKDFLRYIFTPRVVIYKTTRVSEPLPEKELNEIWKKQEELFKYMNRLFDKL
jgi:hypothetical protein